MLLQRRPRLTPEQVLASRPLRNPALRAEPLEDGGLKVYVGRRNDWWIRLLATIFPIPTERIVELDKVGSEVWELCDGENTLRDITQAFRERHKLTRAEADWSLRTYLKDLGKRGLVGFVVDKEGGAGEESVGVVVKSDKESEEGEEERAHGKRA